MRKIFVLSALFYFLSPLTVAQKTSVYSEINAHYKEGLRLFAEGVYNGAKTEFEKVLADHRASHEPEYGTLLMYSEYYIAISSLRLGLEDADLMVTEFIKKHKPDPIAEKANLEVANYHFDQKNYDEAIRYYKLMDTRGLSQEMISEIKFKEGYSYFAKKDFKNALVSFSQVKDQKSEFWYPTNYYMGMSNYFLGNYDVAVQNFQVAGKSKKYADLIPYYIAQIYFSKAQYDKLISYADPILQGTQKVEKADQIKKLIGHAYFLKKDYSKALQYLEAYNDGKNTLEESDYYVLGYCNYQAKKFDKAIPYFTAISGQSTSLGQNANYYLADCFLKTGNTQSAKTAFYNVSKLSFNENIKEEALFNYGKLSAELGYDRDCIQSLSTIASTSKYYIEAQNIMGDVLERTNDYDNALRTIEAVKNPTQRLKSAYQQLAYKRGLQLIREERPGEARNFLNKAITPSYDQTISTSAKYWIAEMDHRWHDYDKSIDEVSVFQADPTSKSLRDVSLLPMSYYLQGYNYLKKENYLQAGEQFKFAIDQLGRKSFSNQQALLGDSYLRAGDCAFKRNKYDDALSYYGQVINRKYAGNDYAQYQSAIIQGLKDNGKEKIKMLESLVKTLPGSKYADEALYELADTYNDQGQTPTAISYLKRLLKDYPQTNIYNRTLIQLGLLSYNQGNKNEALNYYKDVFKHNPTKEESQDALTAIQEIYVDDLGQPDEYIKFVESIPGGGLNNYAKDSLNYSVALRYYENGNYDQAITAFSDYLQKFPRGLNTLPATFKRGEAYAIQKKYDQALTDYESVISRGQSEYYQKSLLKAATIAYNSSQNFEKAYKYYAELANQNVDDNTLFESQLGAMRSAYRTNRTKDVINYGEKVATSTLANKEQKATASFYLGKIYFDQNNYTQAKDYLQNVVNNSDNVQTAEARYLLASIQYNLKSPDAEATAKKAVQSNSNYPYWVAKSLILLSDIFADKNDLLNARGALEAVLDNYKEDPEITKTAQTKLDAVKKRQASTNKLLPTDPKSNQFFDTKN